MDVLVVSGRDEQEVEGGCERICSTACGVVSPAGRRDAGITESSAEPKPGQKESEPSPEAVSPASSSGADEAAADKVCTIPAESEGLSAHDSETREAAVEGDSRGELTEVIELPELDAGHPEATTEATTEVIGAVDPSALPADDSAGEAMRGADEEQAVPQFSAQASGLLLDETKGDLIAWEDFKGTVNDRAFENEWLGAHNDISREAIREELLRTGRYTAHIDEADNLLSDPEECTLAVELEVQITYCVHRGWTKDQKREFILRSQTGKRMLTYEQQRELKNSLMAVRLRLGVDYKTIGKMFGVHPNTVRNVEKRAAADPNSKFGITQPPDRRCAPETREKIAKAIELRKEGKSNAIIAEIFGTDVETVGKWLKDPPARDKAKRKAKGGNRKKTITANDGPPEIHQHALEHLNQDAQYYDELHELAQGDVQKEVKKMSGSVEDLLYYAIYGSQLAAAADARLEQLLPAGDEEDVVEEAPPGDSSPDEAGYETSEILSGNVPEFEPDLAPVSLPTGDRGVIAEGDTGVARQAVAEDGDEARVRVNGFDPEPGHPDRESMAQDDRTRAVEPNLDDRSSPYDRFFGRKGEPKK